MATIGYRVSNRDQMVKIGYGASDQMAMIGYRASDRDRMVKIGYGASERINKPIDRPAH
jgi:hypothetical protein